MRRAVPHGVGCEYPQYPPGGTASVRSTHSAVWCRRLTLWAGAAASFARRGVCRPMITAGSWVSPTAAPVTSASSARPSPTYRCARTAEYPLEYPRTAAPVRRLRTADAPRSAARRGLRVPAVPCRRYRLGAQYSQRSGVPPADPLGGRRRELSAAWRVQANEFGGLVSIFGGRANGISVIGSTLTNITVRAHCRVPSQYLSAPRLPSGGSAPLTRRAGPHGVGCEYPQYPYRRYRLGTHSEVGHRRLTFGRAPPRGLRGVGCAGLCRRARGYRQRWLRQRQRRRLDPHKHIGARALPSTVLSTRAPRLPSGGSAPLMRRAVAHGVGCEYPQYPAGVAASVL
jgi:hypothetical protein